jgi:hypothetical protein
VKVIKIEKIICNLNCNKETLKCIPTSMSKLGELEIFRASLQEMVITPDYASVSSILEGTESQVFRSKLDDWDDLIVIDYTRKVESVHKRGAHLRKVLL